MTPRGLDRRQLITALCALGIAASPLARATATPCMPLAEGIDPRALRELAAQVAAASSPLAGDAALAALQRELSAPDAIERLRRRTLDDYARDRVIVLGSWRVSHTEATLYVALSRCV